MRYYDPSTGKFLEDVNDLQSSKMPGYNPATGRYENQSPSLNPETNDFLSSLTGLDFNKPPTPLNEPSQLFLPKVQDQEVQRSPAAVSNVQFEMPSQVKDYLIKKSQLSKDQAPTNADDPFSDAKREELKKLAQDKKSNLGWFQFGAGIGDAIAGRNPAGTNEYFEGLRSKVDSETIGDFDRRKKQGFEDYNNKRIIEQNKISDDQRARDMDPNSEESRMAQSLAVKMGLDPAKAKNLTAAKFKEQSQVFSKMYEIEQRRLDRAENRALKASQYKNRDIEMLPKEDQEVVTDLAKKNASKISIANQIDAVMSNWDKLPDDQKVSQGRSLLKTLNSTEGSDAVGAEEAKRLGAKLEFAIGNFTNSNPTQFGRDLEGFKQQAADTSNAIKKAVQSNNQTISDMYSRVGINKNPNVRANQPKANQVERRDPKSGKIVIYNADTKKFLGWKDE